MILGGVAAAALATAAAVSSPAVAAECRKGPVTVGYIPKLDTDPFFQSANTGAQQAQKEIGGKILLQAPSEATAEAQIAFINNMVTQGVDVIAISGNDANAVAPALRRAEAQNIWVIAYDSDVAPKARSLFVNQAKSELLGEGMLESLGRAIGYEGEFAILSSTPTATNQNKWIANMKHTIATDPKFAKMKLVQVAYGQESEQINQQQTLALVQAFPQLKGIIVPAGIGLPAAARALDQAGLLGKIKLSGLGPVSLLRKYIRNGSVQDVWWSVPDLGYLSYYAAQGLARCKFKAEPGATFTAGHLGQYTVGTDTIVLLGPPKVATPENVDSFAF
ncbi:substrate-binding domain-containing protein [Lichenicoccus roseus]|uniref:Substrate-binding domain-containing protein n=2 Tax=Lichenicoccus roseus TaxID=2683649 RepID=A0A5R9J7U6_9PROT|nr:substrate-binding domain-containing protein [Lichenicoccus roseus]